MGYQDRVAKDWSFSDRVHEFALKEIYGKFDNIKKVEKATVWDDRKNGIDYWVVYDKGTESVQERFRTLNRFTENSFEFTLRYERPNSASDEQKKSEFFKIKADFLLYGITNTTSTEDEITSFKRFVFIDLEKLLKEINLGTIKIDENEANRFNQPYMKKDTPYAIVKRNKEEKQGNSSLVVFNVLDLNTLDKGIVLYSEGYESTPTVSEGNKASTKIKV